MTTLFRWNEQNLYIGAIEVDEFGDLPLRSTPTAPPDVEEGQCLVWQGQWLVADEPPVGPEPDWPALIATRRYQAETAGITVNEMVVATDDRSQALIIGAALQALIDSEYSLQWKTAAGFVQLTGQQVLALASAVRAHVQACFDREAELLAAVADDSITNELLEQGWPA